LAQREPHATGCAGEDQGLTDAQGLPIGRPGNYAIGGRNSLETGCDGAGNAIGSEIRMDSKRTSGTVTTAAMSA
jgi:hypothetical protein